MRANKLKAILDQIEIWLFPASLVALGIALAFLWYANARWRETSGMPRVVVGQMSELPERPPPSPKRP
jgi:uncharacterized membrane protein